MNGAMRLIVAMAVAGVVNTAAGVEAVGNRTCSLWLAHMGRASNTSWTQIAAQQWLAGYLSGLAQGTGIDVLHGVDMEAVYASMDQYCRSNPTSSLRDGGNLIFADLKGKRAIKSPL